MSLHMHAGPYNDDEVLANIGEVKEGKVVTKYSLPYDYYKSTNMIITSGNLHVRVRGVVRTWF